MGPDPGHPLGDRPLRDTLARGVAEGVITAAQRDALLALAPRAEGERSAAVAVAYWLGAALVVFALGWFLAERWNALGPGGVLAVAVGYGALFAGAAHRLARARFPLAAGVALALVTLTASLAAWALLRLTGAWPAPAPANSLGDPLLRYEPYMATRRLVVELTNVLAVLLAVRFVSAGRVRRVPLAVPLAVATAAAFADGATLVALAFGDTLRGMYGWTYATAGAALFGVAYETDRRQPPGDDVAGWLYAASCVLSQAGLVGAFGDVGWWRHALAAVAVLQLAAGTRLGRRPLLAAGAANVVWYLGWLAFELFRDVVAFPLLLAGLGAAVLALTVLVQRRWPWLVRGRAAPRRPSLPGGSFAAWAPAAVCVALLAAAVPAARRPVRAPAPPRPSGAPRDPAPPRRSSGPPPAPPTPRR